MKIKFVKRKNIDIEKWNDCIKNAHNEMIYGYSWFLDHISANWAALIFEDYKMVMPLCVRSKMAIPYICQPPFSQKTAIFSTSKLSETTTKAFYKAIPKKFVLWDFFVDDSSLPTINKAKTEAYTNIVLKLNGSTDEHRKLYSSNCKRNLKKAVNFGWRIKQNENIEKSVKHFRTNRGKDYESDLTNTDYQNFIDFAHQCFSNKKGTLYVAKSQQKEYGGSIFVAESKNAYYALFTDVSELGMKNGAMFALFDFLIKSYSNSGKTLDFEGSMNPGIARFYKGFGGKEVKYYRIYRNKLKI